jgi:hypothetical protein
MRPEEGLRPSSDVKAKTDNSVCSELWMTTFNEVLLATSASYKRRLFVSQMINANRYIVSMFSTVAIVNHIQEDDENDRFYAQAELLLTQDVSQAHIALKNVSSSVQATVLMNAKAGRNAFDISGNGISPFKLGDTIKVTCFEKGEVP